MATVIDSTELGPLSAAYLRAAEAGRTLDRAGKRHSPAGVRSLRRALVQIEAAAGPLDAADLKAMDAGALERLGRRVIEHEGLPPSRLDTIVDALRGLSAHAGTRLRPADLPPPPEPDPAAAAEAKTPTFTMLALGAQVSAWTQRIIVIAFVLTAIGLAIELV